MKTLTTILASLLLTGCALLSGGLEAPDVNLKSVKALPAEGLEQRFEIVLGLTNPNDRPIEFDGINLELELNGKRLGRALGNTPVRIDRLDRAEVTLTGVVSVFDALRSAIALSNSTNLDYRLHGRLYLANSPASLPFSRSGSLDPDKALNP